MSSNSFTKLFLFCATILPQGGCFVENMEEAFCDPGQGEVDLSALGDWRGSWASEDGEWVLKVDEQHRPNYIYERDFLSYDPETDALSSSRGDIFGCKADASPLVEQGENLYAIKGMIWKRERLTSVKQHRQSIELNYEYDSAPDSDKDGISYFSYRFSVTSKNELIVETLRGDPGERLEIVRTRTFRSKWDGTGNPESSPADEKS